MTLAQVGALPFDANTAARFNGTSGRMDVNSYAGLNRGDGPLSIELWVKRARTGRTEVLVSKGTGAYEVRFDLLNRVVLYRPGSGSIVASTVTISNTNWHHIVVTKSGTTSRIYIDGANVTGTVSNRTLTNSTTALRIGSDGTNEFSGTIDEVAIYGSALSAATVSAHYAARL